MVKRRNYFLVFKASFGNSKRTSISKVSIATARKQTSDPGNARNELSFESQRQYCWDLTMLRHIFALEPIQSVTQTVTKKPVELTRCLSWNTCSVLWKKIPSGTRTSEKLPSEGAPDIYCWLPRYHDVLLLLVILWCGKITNVIDLSRILLTVSADDLYRTLLLIST